MNHGNNGRPPYGGKPQGGQGISSAQAAELTKQVSETRERLQALEALLGESNQWNNKVRRWVGKRIAVHLVTEEIVYGTLKGLDRYTLSVEGYVIPSPDEKAMSPREMIVHKGSIAIIYEEEPRT